jgi:predicted outer membrane repeat protein
VTISGNTASLDGGGLRLTSNSGATLTDVAITDNQAGNGGGISTSNSLTLNGVTISSNTASLDGGGVYSFGTTPGSSGLTNVTITNNSATGNGGGLRAAGANPMVQLPNLSLSQATVSHNSAPNGSNISRSTGPIFLRNTIVSDPNPNNDPNDPDDDGENCAGVVINSRNNLESLTNTCGFGSANESKSGPNVKVNLGDLANNGGPIETRALLSGSAAIDAGSGFVGTSLDQRHEPRPKDGDGNDTDGRADGNAEHDIGAYELQAPITPDNTAPVITKVVTGTLGLNSWYTSNVEVDWTVVDDESNLSSQSGCDDFSVTSDQQATTYTCEATSAGGTSSDSVTIKRDATAPNFDCDSAGGNWHANDVNIACTASDGGSGLADDTNDASFNLTTNVASNTEDNNASTNSKTVSDNAGNSATAGPISGNKVDKKAPSFKCGSADADWHATNQTFNCTASDGGSGLTPTSDETFQLSTSVADGDETSIASTGEKVLTDGVSNTMTAPAITGVKGDMKAPVLTDDGPTTQPDGDNDWYKSAVTNGFKATDGGSGFVPNADLTKSFTNSSGTNDGNAVKIASGSVSDAVGNSGASIDSTAFKIDLSDPTNVTFQGGPAADGSYDFGDTPDKPTCTANDAISGFASCEVTGYSTAVGAHTMTATAKDNAGRTATATRSYTVKAWTTKGLYQPVDMNGVYNTVKGGSTVPLKFELLKGTTELTDTANVKSLQTTKITCASGATIDDIETVATGGTSLRYDSTGGQFIYNWKTPTDAGSCYKVTITANDGSSLSAYFKLK